MNNNFEKIEKEVDKMVREELNKVMTEKTMGYFYHFERRKKEILKKEYNIDWETSTEKNPGIIID